MNGLSQKFKAHGNPGVTAQTGSSRVQCGKTYPVGCPPACVSDTLQFDPRQGGSAVFKEMLSKSRQSMLSGPCQFWTRGRKFAWNQFLDMLREKAKRAKYADIVSMSSERHLGGVDGPVRQVEGGVKPMGKVDTNPDGYPHNHDECMIH